MNNIQTLIYLLVIVGGLEITNIVLGTLMGTMETSFNLKKFLFGILKAIVIALCIVATCVLAEMFAFVLNQIEGITITAQIVSALEIIMVIVAWCLDLFKDILEKIKGIKTLKFISYADVYDKGYGEEDV